MNRKRDGRMTRKMHAEDLSLEVVHPSEAGQLTSAMKRTTSPCRPDRDNKISARFGAPRGVKEMAACEANAIAP